MSREHKAGTALTSFEGDGVVLNMPNCEKRHNWKALLAAKHDVRFRLEQIHSTLQAEIDRPNDELEKRIAR